MASSSSDAGAGGLSLLGGVATTVEVAVTGFAGAAVLAGGAVLGMVTKAGEAARATENLAARVGLSTAETKKFQAVEMSPELAPIPSLRQLSTWAVF